MKIIKLIKRWFNMLTGKSVFHVKQGIGKYYSKKEIKGYYNDLTGKVCDKTILDGNGIPITTTIAGIKAYFPIAIFQYGLGLYDLYIETNNKEYKEKFLNIADWAIDNIDSNGMWNCMGTLKDSKHYTQSAMCQGEGISILIRAHKETNNKKYEVAAKNAFKYMIRDVNDNGTCSYKNNEIIFQEYVYNQKNKDISVLNGWVFSLFGLLDYSIYFKDNDSKITLSKSLKSLIDNLKNYDRKFWTNYDQVGTIASPAYHDIHIRQLLLLYDLTGKKEFKIYADKWLKYSNKKINRLRAMIIKLFQKLRKNKYYDINTSTI